MIVWMIKHSRPAIAMMLENLALLIKTFFLIKTCVSFMLSKSFESFFLMLICTFVNLFHGIGNPYAQPWVLKMYFDSFFASK